MAQVVELGAQRQGDKLNLEPTMVDERARQDVKRETLAHKIAIGDEAPIQLSQDTEAHNRFKWQWREYDKSVAEWHTGTEDHWQRFFSLRRLFWQILADRAVFMVHQRSLCGKEG